MKLTGIRLVLSLVLLWSAASAQGDYGDYRAACESNPCPFNFDCVDDWNGGYRCIPLFGNPCDPNPCGFTGDYTCVPDSSSQGYHCEWNSLCLGSTCPDGATCQSDPTVIFTCLCPGGATYNYDDNTCASSDPCAQSPCAHGTCVPDGSQATCNCTGTGFKGATCSEQIRCLAKSESNAAWPEVNAGSTTTGSCAPGFQGVISRDCQLDGTFGPIKGSCLPSCTPGRSNNATWTATIAGQVATGSCDDGFSGTPKRRCLPNGTWKATLESYCTRTQCNGTTEGNAVWGGALSFQAVTGQCLPGFQGRAWRTCQGNGQYGPINGGCTAVQTCPALSFLHAAWPETQPGQTATGTCDPGYEGTPTRVCSAKGFWESVSAPCQRRKCLAINDANAAWAEASFGDTVFGTCQAPYSGRVHRKCLEGGVFGPITGTCFGPCPAMIDGPAAFGQTPPGQTATGVCQQGYTGTPTKYCSKDGIWQAGGRPCQVIMCSSMTDAVATFLRTAAGTTSTGICRKGAGVITRFCGLDGKFEPAQGACI